MEKEKLEIMVNEGKSIGQISKICSQSINTIRYWLNKYSIKPAYSRKSRKIWSDEQMLEAIKTSNTISQVLRKVGLKVRPGNYTTFNNFCLKNNIDLSHMTGEIERKPRKSDVKLKDVMTEKSTYARHLLKRRLLKERLLENKCNICGLFEQWQGKPIVLVLDHINGVNDDNRLENLRMLCPNCNSQQETFCGKSKKRATPISERGRCLDCGTAIYKNSKRCIKCRGIYNQKTQRPNREELESLINKMSFVAIGKKYSVSDNTIRKWAKSYGLI
jgi:hypothetical protein